MAPRIFTVTPNPGIDRTLTVPELELNEVLRSSESRIDAGGKGFNVSRALMAMGMESVAIAFLGGDAGRLEERMLRDAGIAVRGLAIQDETRSCYVVTDPEGRRHVKVNEPGPHVSASEQAALLGLVEQEAREGDLWVLAGSLPRGVPIDFYRSLIERLHAQGARALLDASGPALIEGLAARPFLVKPNALEASQATGIRVDSPAEAARAVRALQQDAEVVAISLGADGMVAGLGAQVIHAAPPTITARNSVGAGDASVAGIVFALAQGFAWEDVVRWGVACGTAAAMRPGVDFGARPEVAQVAAQVQARAMS